MKLTAENKNAIILAIDDNEATLGLIDAILRGAGFKNIHLTREPHKASSLFRELNPDVILLDLNMPSMGGFDVLAMFKKECNAEYLPVIILTGDDDVEIKVKVLECGAKDFIAKPFDHFEMLARINTIVAMSTFYKELLLKNKSLDRVVSAQTNSLMYAVKQKEEAEEKLQKNLLHDGVTGLPNRYLFEDRLSQFISVSKRNETNVAVIVLGFDNYTEIDNVIGHHAYDELLRKITVRLKAILRTSDTVSIIQDATSGTALSRLGEDMFAIIVPIFRTLDDIDRVIGRCAASLLTPIDLPDIMFDIIIRGGVSYFPDHGDTSEELIQHANNALYHAREEHKNYMIYDISHDYETKYRLNLMTELKKGLECDDLELFYQPKIDLNTNRVMGCEALIRWTHPEYGFVSPDSFIPVAEQTGTIRLVTTWVIEKAMMQWAKWQAMGIELAISINVSTYDLSDSSFVSLVKKNLEKYNVIPSNIILEVTENSTMQDPATAMNILNHLSVLGVKLSIDDYGTGYSSLSYLKSLPVDEIKIDKSFVMNMDTDRDNSVIVKSTIDLAHNLGYQVVAEGIENKTIYAMLQAYNCDTAQGFFMSRPLPASEIENWLIEKKWKFA